MNSGVTIIWVEFITEIGRCQHLYLSRALASQSAFSLLIPTPALFPLSQLGSLWQLFSRLFLLCHSQLSFVYPL